MSILFGKRPVMYAYGFSLTGTSHIKKETTCQDANKIDRAKNGWVVAAIADGVGSAKHSDLASKIAVGVSVKTCVDEINSAKGKPDILKIVEATFTQAFKEIEDTCWNNEHIITDYDTTLTLAIYDGKHIAYGHSGDGGIIGLRMDGEYERITEPQKAEGIFVIPLRAGKDTWVIGRAENEYAAVLLATDGVYDAFFPYLLAGKPYVPLVRYFCDNNVLKLSKENLEEVAESRENYFKSKACAAITDDKTLVAIVNTAASPKRQDDSYYAEPDWQGLKLEWNKKAYPHMFGEVEQKG